MQIGWTIFNRFKWKECKYFSFLRFLSLKLCRFSDALALNIGQDDWELVQVAAAYAAAESLGTDFKLFFSFDFTVMSCTLSDFVSIVNQYANHPNQFKVNGKPMISSFEGGCLGNTGWASLKNQTNGYNMPFISSLEGTFSQWPALDSWLWLVWFDENILCESNHVC